MLHDGKALIFVSIAAYRDPQLVPTIEDCIGKARHPERLRFGICWQHDPDEDTLPFVSNDCFRILAVDWRESKGACWARSEVMKLWRGERWFLQIDSHCRFASEWDTKLIEEARQTGSLKPILSTYAASFTPSGNEMLIDGALQMAFQGFTDDGIPFMKPMAIPGWQTLRRPRRARFLSAGFLFAPGKIAEELGYDPDFYFLGEETAITLRAFTSGYDLFHPFETIVWHDYGQPNAIKHWDDHTKANNTKRTWHEIDSQSKDRVRQLLAGELMDRYGVGSARTIRDYEEYAGLSFKLRRVQDYTLRSEEPPNPEMDPDWAGQIFTWLVRITIERAVLLPEALDDPEFWYVGIYDEDGNEIYRRDVPSSQLATLPAEEPRIVLICELESGSIPARWRVHPVSRLRGWLAQIEGTLAEEDYAIVAEDDSE